MEFLYPAFLWALLAIAIPIIIHLFNFRKFKKVYFPNVRFLKEVKQETQSRSKLKHLLVLLCRILAIAFLVFAFAQPYIPVSDNIITGRQAVSIYIDNSFSMGALARNGTLLDEAKKKAAEIVKAYEPSDKFQLLTNDFEGRHQRLLTAEEFSELLQEVKESPYVKNISQVLSRQHDLLNNSGFQNKTAYLISDFQENIFDAAAISSDTSVKVTFVPIEAQQAQNVYIDSVWFRTPVRQLNQPEELFVRIRNASDKTAENIPVKLFINGQQKTPASFSVEAGGSTTVPLSFTLSEPGLKQGLVSITDYPITYDDHFYFSFTIAESIPVMAINQEKESSYINSLFGSDAYFRLTNASEKNIDYATLPSFRFIILNEINSLSSGLAQELKRFAENGGHLLIFPSVDADINSYNEFLRSVNAAGYKVTDTVNTKVSRLNTEHEIYRDVFERIPENIDLPVVLLHYPVTVTARTMGDWLMRLQNGTSFISQHNFGKGRIYLCAAGLDRTFGNFSKHALFVPTLYSMGLHSVRSGRLYYTIGSEETIEAGTRDIKGDKVWKLRSADKKTEIIPEIYTSDGASYLRVHGQINEAGNYALAAEEAPARFIAFNYSRKESDLTALSEKNIENKIEEHGLENFQLIKNKNKDLTLTISEANTGKRLWKWCVILTLLFLAAESAIIKFWK